MRVPGFFLAKGAMWCDRRSDGDRLEAIHRNRDQDSPDCLLGMERRGVMTSHGGFPAMAGETMRADARLVPGAILLAHLTWATLAWGSSVTVSEQDTGIPTYLAGAPEKSPMFFFGRQSQGAEGRIYPYPLYDTLTGRKVDKTYKLVYLENEYVKVGILPEIGGRIFEAVDKTNNYDYFYHQ